MTFPPVGEIEKLINKIRKLVLIHRLEASKTLNNEIKYKFERVLQTLLRII